MHARIYVQDLDDNVKADDDDENELATQMQTVKVTI